METRFNNLIQAHNVTLQHAALKLCHGDSAMAEDMVQDTYVKALLHREGFAPGSNLRAWLLRILYNTIISAYRHRRVARENPLPDGFAPAAQSPADSEVSDTLQRALRELPDDYRRVFLMATLEESPYEDIAGQLGIPVGTVMSRLWRARQSLQRRLCGAELN